jgi:hypothetical protein
MAELPSFKARPEWVGPVLALFREHAGHYSALEEAIAHWWQNQSARTRPPHVRNSLRAVFGPTLRHLSLITGAGENITVTHQGDRLLTAQAGGEAQFKKQFAAHVTRLDHESWIRVLPYLNTAQTPPTLSQLVEHIRESYPSIPHIDTQKLTKYLNYFAFTGLVQFSGPYVNLRIKQYEAARTGAWTPLPPPARFVHAVERAYDRLSAGNIYVPIPLLRDAVCRELGIWDDEFDTMLLEMPKETHSHIVQLSAPMARARGGLRIGGAYVYYIAVHRKA